MDIALMSIFIVMGDAPSARPFTVYHILVEVASVYPLASPPRGGADEVGGEVVPMPSPSGEGGRA